MMEEAQAPLQLRAHYHVILGQITRAMDRKLEEDWNTATDDRETYLYMLKEAIISSVE